MYFARRLATYIAEDYRIVYVDETSMNSWCSQKRAFFHRDKKFIVPMNTNRGKNFTVYGGVGDCLRNKFYSEIHDRTCAVDFSSFIRNLAA